MTRCCVFVAGIKVLPGKTWHSSINVLPGKTWHPLIGTH